MGHAIFIILHILAVLFGLIGLIITIPLHIIYSAVVAKNDKPNKKSKEFLWMEKEELENDLSGNKLVDVEDILMK